MAVTAESFLVCYPEFAKAGSDMLAGILAQVEYQVSDAFGDQRDAAVMLRLADTLALSPWGRDAQLVSSSASTSRYGERFQRLAEANAVSASRMGSILGSALGALPGGDDGGP